MSIVPVIVVAGALAVFAIYEAFSFDVLKDRKTNSRAQ